MSTTNNLIVKFFFLSLMKLFVIALPTSALDHTQIIYQYGLWCTREVSHP